MEHRYAKMNAAQQLAAQMRQQIEQGRWRKGGVLPSMRELAGQYGVSLSTVHKAVRELASLDLIDYRPGQRGVVKKGVSARQQVVWVEPFDPSIQVSSWGEIILRGARGVLGRAGLRLTMITYDLDHAGYLDQVMRMLEPIIDDTAGLYCQDYHGLLTPVLEYAERKGVPWMMSTPSGRDTRHNFVAADNLEGGRMAGRCFAQLGIQRIAMLNIGMGERSAQDKAGGLCMGYFEQELSPPAIDLVGAFDQEEASGYEAMSRYLQTHEPPQGIFTIGDLLAIGAIRACRDAGLRVPEDVSVIGSTGIPRRQLPFTPTLAAVAQPMQEMGEQVAAGLVYMIREGVRRIGGRSIPCHFVPGHSVNAPESLQRQWALGPGGLRPDSSPAADAAEHSSYPSEVQHGSIA